jgi:hypothetical protein
VKDLLLLFFAFLLLHSRPVLAHKELLQPVHVALSLWWINCWSYRPFIKKTLPVEKLLLLCSLTLLVACRNNDKEIARASLINTAHLNHLFQEVKSADSSFFGTIWIYCEAPDYRLTADEDEGFTCVDDVARALVFHCRQYQTKPDAALKKRIEQLSAFLLHQQAENGYFYNFLLPDKQVNKTHQNSQAVAGFWTWRALWALTEIHLIEAREFAALKAATRPALEKTLANVGDLCIQPEPDTLLHGISLPACLMTTGGDQLGIILTSLASYYSLYPSEKVKQWILSIGNLLEKSQQGADNIPPYGAFPSWQNSWHAWGNIQAYSLLKAGAAIDNDVFLQLALREIKHFYPFCIAQGYVNSFNMTKDSIGPGIRDLAQFPQIAYGIRPMVFAATEAYKVTGDEACAETAGQLATWLFGNNPAGIAMYDPVTGRTFDGIGSKTDVNRNSGAESTIEGLLILQAVEACPPAAAILEKWKAAHSQ